MANQFTKQAQQRWHALPEPICTTAQNDLLLEGKCQRCGAKVRRLID
jgi:hypothetical protein